MLFHLAHKLAALVDLVAEFADALVPQAKLALQVGDALLGCFGCFARGWHGSKLSQISATSMQQIRALLRFQVRHRRGEAV